MANNTTLSSRRIARVIALGILLSIITMFLLHYFGMWEVKDVRPDADTTSSVVLYNTCAVIGDTHTLRPANATSSAATNIDELKFSGSFMNFFDGHIIAMIALAFLISLVLFFVGKLLKP